MLRRWMKAVPAAMKKKELHSVFIASEWMRRNASFAQYVKHHQEKNTYSGSLLNEATLERNVGGCKLNTWCDGQAMSSIHGVTDGSVVILA